MCIVVDPPLFVALFNPKDARHNDFRDVLSWVRSGKGKFVIGGSQYATELAAIKSYLPVLKEFERNGRVVVVDTRKIDAQILMIHI
jgi:hypothetical protein